MSHIQGVDPVHFLLGEGEVPDIKIMFYALPVDGLGNDHHAPLDMPMQGYLGGSLTVGAANLRENRVGKQTELSFGKGTSGRGDYAVIRHGIHGLLLVEDGVDFYLVRFIATVSQKSSCRAAWRLLTSIARSSLSW